MQIFFRIFCKNLCNELKNNITFGRKKIFNNAVLGVIFAFWHPKYATFYHIRVVKYSKKQYKILKQWKITPRHKEGD